MYSPVHRIRSLPSTFSPSLRYLHVKKKNTVRMHRNGFFKSHEAGFSTNIDWKEAICSSIRKTYDIIYYTSNIFFKYQHNNFYCYQYYFCIKFLNFQCEIYEFQFSQLMSIFKRKNRIHYLGKQKDYCTARE